MEKYLTVLKKYWGYDAFRPLQSDIIQSIGNGKDTLGLMPTGGGKSLTFQVPTMAMEGICIVVTPLIALMKDQVENLKARDIKAVAIYSGMDSRDIDRMLENCIYGDFKFLYLSPERLSTEAFLRRLPLLPICMIAVDESHCISQWGYDFRPSYLKISDIRAIIPAVPILALTATATPDVVVDIQERLAFKAPNVFQKSFARSNLVYVVRHTENKSAQLLRILQRIAGTSVVYVRNRKRTKEIADFLVENGITAAYFHAGLNNEEKDERQQHWKNDITRVIVSTNAFGMGIDKPNVRTVIHLDLPDTLEAYFQEAGRAGRDEKKAFAVLLYNNTDATKIKKRIADSFPEKDFIRRVYDALGNYYQIGVGSGLERVFPFDIGDFCTKFHFPILTAYSALKIIQQAGYLELTDDQDSSSRIMFIVNKEDLYHAGTSEQQEQIIHILLRSYTGMFTNPANVNEELIANRLGIKRRALYDQLILLSKAGIISYIPRKKTPFITFLRERELPEQIVLNKTVYENRKERYIQRINCVLQYAQQNAFCRSQVLLSYFGEQNAEACGQCDICLKNKEQSLQDNEFQKIRRSIIALLNNNTYSVNELVTIANNYPENKVIKVLRFALDQGEIITDAKGKLSLKSK